MYIFNWIYSGILCEEVFSAVKTTLKRGASVWNGFPFYYVYSFVQVMLI